MKMTNNNLAVLVYDKGLRAQIEEHYESKYEQRIEYLVNANNELMYELEQCELECYGRGVEVQKYDKAFPNQGKKWMMDRPY